MTFLAAGQPISFGLSDLRAIAALVQTSKPRAHKRVGGVRYPLPLLGWIDRLRRIAGLTSAPDLAVSPHAILDATGERSKQPAATFV